MMIKRSVYLSVIAIALCSFSWYEMALSSYVSYVQNVANGLHKQIVVEGLLVDVQYEPHDFKALKYFRKKTPTQTDVLAYKEGLGNNDYLILKLSGLDGENLLDLAQTPEQYADLVRYYSFEMQKDLVLRSGNDTIACSLFHFENSFSMSPNLTFVLGFDQSAGKTTRDKIVLEYNEVVFDKGNIRVSIDQNDIDAVPQLMTK